MTRTSETLTLEKLISQIESGEIRVNTAYQRSGQIWPARAKSFLVETVLRNMPIPRVLLHDVDHPKPPHKSDIIDGQQRCTILRQFQNGGFALTTAVDTESLHGKRFADLTARQRAIFQSYKVFIDRYSGSSSRHIRQVFRRLNYYTAPLNAAEQRHAQFFGALSRFVEAQSREWGGTFRRLRVFTKRQLNRRSDDQLMAEVVDAMLNGLSTTTAKSLRGVYQRNEKQFSSARDFGRRLERARTQIDQWAGLGDNTLMRKHYQVFAFLLAVMHAQGDLLALRGELGPKRPLLPDDRIMGALAELDAAVINKALVGDYAAFWTASQEKTNVKENRTSRCQYFYNALTGGPGS